MECYHRQAAQSSWKIGLQVAIPDAQFFGSIAQPGGDVKSFLSMRPIQRGVFFFLKVEACVSYTPKIVFTYKFP